MKLYGLTICTGYRGTPGARLDGIREYEGKASDIYHTTSFKNFDEGRKAIENLLKEFCVKNGGKTYETY